MASLGDGGAGRLEISTAVEPQGVAVIRLVGDVDISNAPRVRDTVTAVAEGRPQRLVFNLADLTFIDSAGLSVLVAATGAVEDVRLRAPSAIVRRVIELTGLTDVLPTESR
jgi:anti-sigma B factor antagonist